MAGATITDRDGCVCDPVPSAQCTPWIFFFFCLKVELQLCKLSNLLGGLVARFTKVPDPDAVKSRIRPNDTDRLDH